MFPFIARTFSPKIIGLLAEYILMYYDILCKYCISLERRPPHLARNSLLITKITSNTSTGRLNNHFEYEPWASIEKHRDRIQLSSPLITKREENRRCLDVE